MTFPRFVGLHNHADAKYHAVQLKPHPKYILPAGNDEAHDKCREV